MISVIGQAADQYLEGHRGSELRELYSIIEEHRDKFIVAWNEHFGQ